MQIHAYACAYGVAVHVGSEDRLTRQLSSAICGYVALYAMFLVGNMDMVSMHRCKCSNGLGRAPPWGCIGIAATNAT